MIHHCTNGSFNCADQGRIAEQRTHDELVAMNGIYAQLWQRQTGGFLIEQDKIVKPSTDKN